MTLFVGQVIHGHYRIDAVLGKGGFEQADRTTLI